MVTKPACNSGGGGGRKKEKKKKKRKNYDGKEKEGDKIDNQSEINHKEKYKENELMK